jgi:hypothetical protein
MNARPKLVFREDIKTCDPGTMVNWYVNKGPRGGRLYYGRSDVKTGPNDEIVFGDLAWGVLLAGRPTYKAAAWLIENAPLDIIGVSTAPLHTLRAKERTAIVQAIMGFRPDSGPASGFRASLASKLLHAKRRCSVPVLDGNTIQTRFMDHSWHPGDLKKRDTLYAVSRDTVDATLETIYRCVHDRKNQAAWQQLEKDFPNFTRVELFDMAWSAIVRGDQKVIAALD